MEPFALKEYVKSCVEVEISAFANKISIGLNNFHEDVLRTEAIILRRDQNHNCPALWVVECHVDVTDCRQQERCHQKVVLRDFLNVYIFDY
jgi:hypothetical protein